ncbi:hypothetical protein PCASD_23037 [Puccinia coronata f. sp. avenae]|uniref:Uncharacterized protein n=1 Tax=Puccinia coronata f. sp. avenae TaxID=200324 RepID=A0A2N5TNB0_9BASI|nr:hypothetical protein PCASD_23037 [Puccinia coronata f. sp. avenae]
MDVFALAAPLREPSNAAEAAEASCYNARASSSPKPSRVLVRNTFLLTSIVSSPSSVIITCPAPTMLSGAMAHTTVSSLSPPHQPHHLLDLSLHHSLRPLPPRLYHPSMFHHLPHPFTSALSIFDALNFFIHAIVGTAPSAETTSSMRPSQRPKAMDGLPIPLSP